MPDILRIYEIVDATDEESYYTIGLFLDRNEALSALDNSTNPPYNDDDPEAVTIEVRERPIGWHPHEFTVIAKRTWTRNYSDERPDWGAGPLITLSKISAPVAERARSGNAAQ